MLDAINFTAEVRDLYDAKGNLVDPEIGRGIYRSDNGELMSIVGRNHKIINHGDVVNPILDAFDNDGYAIHERELDVKSLYDLKGRKGVFVNTSLAKGGALMRTDLICGDFIEPKTSWKDGRDTMFHRVTLLNSHDGSTAVHCATSYLRLICLNGMVSASWSASTRAKHTAGVNINALRAKIANSAKLMGEDAATFTKYARTPVSLDQATNFFRATIAKLEPDTSGNARWTESLVMQMLANFKGEDQTAWGVWNAMTAWATHNDDRRAGAVALTTTNARESRVAVAMRSKEWGRLIAA